MKHFLCLNDHLFDAYWSCLQVALATAPKDMEPHFIYDGPDRPELDVLQSRGVIIHRHRVTIADRLIEYYRPLSHECCMWCQDKTLVALGVFLRCEIPLFCDDEYVLYTDCDVMFTGQPMDELELRRPLLFCAAPEFDRNDWSKFNAGVMLLNLPNLRKELWKIPFHLAEDYDQTALFGLANGRWSRLNPLYNWRPYWGVNTQARIVHFHGPKPDWKAAPTANPETITPLKVAGFQQYEAEWMKIRDAVAV